MPSKDKQNKPVLPDGDEILLKELPLETVMLLIEKTARWVCPETHKLLPIWYPEYARKGLLYNNNWSEPQMNKNRLSGKKIHKAEGNQFASKALTYGLGLRTDGRKGWSCCHIWGVDDPKYQLTNLVVQDNRFFSSIANMILLPTALKTFTDTIPNVKTMIRICATHLYGWQCDHPSMKDAVKQVNDWNDWDIYPKSWPSPSKSGQPHGVMPINDDIKKSAERRWGNIQTDLKEAGQYYPREKVMAALDYWGLDPKRGLKAQ